MLFTTLSVNFSLWKTIEGMKTKRKKSETINASDKLNVRCAATKRGNK